MSEKSNMNMIPPRECLCKGGECLGWPGSPFGGDFCKKAVAEKAAQQKEVEEKLVRLAKENATLRALVGELMIALERHYNHTKNDYCVCGMNEGAKAAIAKAKEVLG